MTMLQNANAIESGGYNINNSIRLRSSNSAYLSRTPASAGNRQIMTYSFWVKRGAITGDYNLTNATTDASNSATLYFNSSNSQSFDVFLKVGGTNYSVTTLQVFRDPSAWYHIIVAIDTTQATSSNRTKVYVNGSQVTNLLSASYVPQNSNLALNNNVAQYIGGTNYFDGYLAEVNFIDGQALTPSSFGQTSTTTGVWQPKQYTGTYGTNGFYLNFSNIALTSGSNTGLGKDYSGNGNYWNTNNISVTSGTTYDAMIDSPTNASSGTRPVGNYSVLNAVNTSSNTITDGNLKTSFSAVGGNRNTIGMSSGKWYWEVSPTTCPSFTLIGIVSASVAITGDISAVNAISYMSQTGYWWRNNVGTAYGATYTTTDIIGIAVDIDNNTITFYKNGTSQGAITSVTLNTDTWFACMGNAASSATVGIYNFGQRPFTYTPPSGYKALCTTNLPDSTIVQGNKYMGVNTYTGTGATQTITNAGGFYPDFTWIKSRSNATNNDLFSAVLSGDNYLKSNSTDGVVGTTNAITSFNSNGFTLGSDSNSIGVNINSNTYVAWQWLANGNSGTTMNTNGSITSYINANTTSGFSQVYWTGTASNGTLGHGLGVAPKFIITKCRGASTDWGVYHASLTSASYYLLLNSTAAQASNATYWNSTAPTSSVFSVGSSNPTNAATAMVAFCFAEIAGFSKFGSYTGNGSADGPFVYLGFRPKFVMLKSTTTAGSNWWIYDTARSTYNTANSLLFPNLSIAEYSGGVEFDIVSNGFKIRNFSNDGNKSGDTFIFAAFAECPTKYALAR